MTTQSTPILPFGGEEEVVTTAPSPCIMVCRMNPGTGMCEGCYRTLDEIAVWSLMDDDEKRAVLAQLPARKP